MLMIMELRSINPLDGLFLAQSETGYLRGFSMEEVWKPVTGFEHYSISNFGRVKNSKNKILKFDKSHNGYNVVSLFSDIRKNCKVHRLVAYEFIGSPEKDHLEVNHINGIKNDNRVENLEWVSRRGNRSHAVTQKMAGTSWDKTRGFWKGSMHIDKKDCFLGYYDTQEDAHKAYMRVLKFMGLENKYARR